MDAEQTRIEADLRGALDGEVFCNPLHTHMYATDASLYQITPIAVVRPRHEEDVAQCVRYAQENSLPILPRGGGTGHAGQAIGPGIVIDFSRFMRRLIKLDRDALTVRVQPGLPLAELNRWPNRSWYSDPIPPRGLSPRSAASSRSILWEATFYDTAQRGSRSSNQPRYSPMDPR